MIYTKRNIYDVPKTASCGVFVKLTGVDYYGNSVELFLPDLSTVFVGAPGVGKTTQIIHCIFLISFLCMQFFIRHEN